MANLTILTVTQGLSFALPLLKRMSSDAERLGANFVVAVDGGDMSPFEDLDLVGKLFHVRSKGFIESVLDEAVAACPDGYILRLDDDEAISPALFDWLTARQFVLGNHWKFPRVHLWKNEYTAIIHPQLWPDVQTRLSLKKFSGGRHTLHAPSPYGGGELAPAPIEHHKFLIKSLEERRHIAAKWHMNDMLAFSCPEDAMPAFTTTEYKGGSL